MRIRWGVIFVVLAAACAAGDVVRTVDGRVLDGTVSFRDGEVHVQPRIGRATRVAAGDVLTIAIGESGGAAGGDDARSAAGELPAGWMARDVGSVGLAGRVAYQGGAYVVTGSGADIGGKADAFQFAYQESAEGDVELVARVASTQITHEQAESGLMIREDESAGARFAAVMARPRGEVAMEVREETAATARQSAAAARVPVWLKLEFERSRGRVRTYRSADGTAWTAVGETELKIEGPVLAGLAVSSHDNGVLCSTRFESVELTRTQRETTEPTGGEDAAVVRPGVVLRDGSVWPGAVREIREGTVNVDRGGRSVAVPIERAARLVLRPVSAERVARLTGGGTTGVLLSSGDFYDGDVAGLQDGRVRVDSVIHGIRQFKLGDAAVVVLAGEEPAAQRPVVVRAVDGTRVSAERMEVVGDRLVISDPLMGEVRWSARELRGVTAVVGRSDPLADLVPSRVEPVDGVALALRRGVLGGSLRLGRRAVEDAVSTPGGTRVTYALDGRHRTFLCTAGIDGAVAPLVAGRVVVRLDGREAFTSAPMTSVDEAVSVAVSLEGARELTLSVEGIDGGVAPSGVWADAVLVRR